ncbi:MAG: hypothetical protein RR054_01110, partial [Clostridia bacterium]
GEVSKNYVIWTLVLAIVFSLLFITGVFFITYGSIIPLIAMLIIGIVLVLVSGFMCVLMWIAFNTSWKTYKRKK